MRVAYYTHTAFFEPALCLVRELSRTAEVDLLLEITPTAWQSAAFDLTRRPLAPGLVPAAPILAPALPAGVAKYWEGTRSFHLVVHPTARSLHPRSWRVSREALAFARGADVLHVDDVDVSPRLALGMPGAHPKTMIAVHDPEPHSGESDWRRPLARRLAYPAAQRFVLFNRSQQDRFAARHAVDRSRVMATHLGSYDILREWGGGASAAAPSIPTVLFFGRLSPYKGLDVFYDALPAIAQAVPGARFVVAGSSAYGYVPPRPPSLQGRPIERIDRYLTTREIAQLLEHASVVVCPYRDATQSGVALSAFAFGTPVVATAVGGLAEYVTPGRTGLLVPAGDAAALAAAVTQVLTDAALAARLRQGIADAAAHELSWSSTADDLLRAYAEC